MLAVLFLLPLFPVVSGSGHAGAFVAAQKAEGCSVGEVCRAVPGPWESLVVWVGTQE